MKNIFLVGADQKSVNAYGKQKLITAQNARLHSLLVGNNGATSFWIQIFDLTAADEAAANTAANSATLEFAEVECPAGGYVPYSWAGGWPFHTGIYVRCVSTQGGSSTDLIAADNAKIDAAYMNGPLSA